MEQYISKSDVVAWIERRQKEEVFYDEDGTFASWADQYHYSLLESIKNFINSLEVKEVDLEKEIKSEINNLCELYCYMIELSKEDGEGEIYPIPENVKNELFEFAKHFFELGLKAKENKL